MLSLTNPIDAVFDIFGLEDTPLFSLRKQPCTDDPNAVGREVGMIEKD